MIESQGAWSEERLYVMRTLEDLKQELKVQAAADAVDRATLLEKQAKDITAAHTKIRALESSGTTLRLKNWVMVGVIIGGLELLRLALHGWKP